MPRNIRQALIICGIVAATALLVFLVGLGTYTLWPAPHHQDLLLYWAYGTSLVRGYRPYVQFHPEYPPLALVFFGAPALASFRYGAYLLGVLTVNAALAGLLALTAACTAPAKERARRAAASLVLVVLIAPIAMLRFDLFPALLTAIATNDLRRGRVEDSGAWLGLGGAAKLYPGVLVPVFALALLAEGRKREAAALCAVAAAVVLGCFAPFLLTDAHAFLGFLRYHAERGLQIETLASGAVLLRGAVAGGVPSTAVRFGAVELLAPSVPAVLGALPWLFLLAYAAVLVLGWRAFRRDGRSPETVARTSLAALLAFVLAGKVFSPQYLAWFLPFLPFAGRRVLAVGIVTAAFTIVLYPWAYAPLLRGDVGAVLLLNARNGAALACFVFSLAGRPSWNPRNSLTKSARAFGSDCC